VWLLLVAKIAFSPCRLNPSGIRGDHFRFGFYKKKSNQTETFFLKPKPNWNRFKPTGFGSARFFQFSSVFFQFFIWVRFGFFSFRLIKPKPNWTSRFFQNFNRFDQFFSRFSFFSYFFFQFSRFNQFFGFFAHL